MIRIDVVRLVDVTEEVSLITKSASSSSALQQVFVVAGFRIIKDLRIIPLIIMNIFSTKFVVPQGARVCAKQMEPSCLIRYH